MPEVDKLRSDSVKDILTVVPHWIIVWGNGLLLTLLFLFLAFSCFIRYPDVIASKALLTTELPPQKEYAKQSGKLSQIFVSNSENVSVAQHLAVIENTANYKDVQYLKGIIDTLCYTKESFEFPIQQIPLLFLGDIEASYANFENNYLQYTYIRNLGPLDSAQKSQKIKSKELKKRLYQLYKQEKIYSSELRLIQTDLGRFEKLYAKGAVSQQELDQKELEYSRAKRNFENLSSSISQINENIKTSEIAFGLDAGNTVNEEVRLLRNTIQSFNQLKKAIFDWEYQYLLKAEIEGNVSFLNFWSVTQEVNVGDLVFIVTPNTNQKHLVKIRVPARNSGKLLVGQKVYLKLDSYPEDEFGKLETNVISISTIPDVEGNYLVDAELPKKLVTNYAKTIPFQNEMTGSAEIITEDLRLIERFFYRVRNILN